MVRNHALLEHFQASDVIEENFNNQREVFEYGGNLMKSLLNSFIQATPADEGGDGAEDAAKDAAGEVESFFESIGPKSEAAWEWIQNNSSEFAVAVGAIAGAFIALRILRAVIAGIVGNKKKDYYAISNVFSRLITSTTSLFLIILAAVLVTPFVPAIPSDWNAYARTAAIIVVIIQLAAWARELLTAGIVGYAHTRAENSGVMTNAVNLIKTLVAIGVWTIALLMILSNLDIEITALIAGLGVGGIAIGLAAQNIFKDLFSSLAIVFDQPFLRGDFISFDKGSFWGDVERIGMKTTRIRSLSGEEIIISNSQLLDKEIRNYRRMDERRSIFTVGVLYQTPHDKLRKIPDLVEEAVKPVEKAQFERSHLKEYGDSSINFENVFWIKSRDYRVYMDINHQVLLNLHRAFEEEGIDFAFPTRTLHVETMPNMSDREDE
ncbi:mechanosensitive ion channel family protein [Hyphococcus sp.]|uniref:mechanosensitive ion channel family protein n=1 Tax=Hyphococcus sp. TaxID=2038636 RepID=UPI003CCBD87C